MDLCRGYKHAEYRNLKSIDMQQFVEDIRNSKLLCVDPSSDLDKLVDCYNKTLYFLLDKHTPVQSRHVTTRVRPPCFNDNIVQREEKLKGELKEVK